MILFSGTRPARPFLAGSGLRPRGQSRVRGGTARGDEPAEECVAGRGAVGSGGSVSEPRYARRAGCQGTEPGAGAAAPAAPSTKPSAPSCGSSARPRMLRPRGAPRVVGFAAFVTVRAPIPCPCVTAAAWVGTSWQRPSESVKHHLSVECSDLIRRTPRDCTERPVSSRRLQTSLQRYHPCARCASSRGAGAFQTSFSSFETAPIAIKNTNIPMSVKRSVSGCCREPRARRAPPGTGRVAPHVSLVIPEPPRDPLASAPCRARGPRAPAVSPERPGPSAALAANGKGLLCCFSRYRVDFLPVLRNSSHPARWGLRSV